MKFMNLKVEQLDEFFEVVKNCKGNVYLKSPDMELNLKSKLCQYLSLAKLCTAGSDEIEELSVYAENSDDSVKLMKFMLDSVV